MNLKVREKALPFLDPAMFDNKNNVTIIKHVVDFNEKYERFPTVPEMKIVIEDHDAFDQMLEIMDISTNDYSNDFILDEIEEFLKMKLVNNVNVSIAMGLHNNDVESIKEAPNKLREALAFSFDTQIGLDFFTEEDRVYNFLHDKEKYVPTPILDLNKAIGGGFHEKSLSLFMAECVDENTLVKVRFKKKIT